MAQHTPPDQYSRTAIALHWLMAVLITGMWLLGTFMDDAQPAPFKFQLYGIHKATGLVVLTLAVLRLTWRLTHRPPLYSAPLPRWQKIASHSTHFGLYALFFALPLSGWLMSSAAGFPVSVYGLFVAPNLISPDKALMDAFKATHEVLANALLLLVGLHTAAALAHHYYFKDTILTRMLPFLKQRTAAIVIAGFVIIPSIAIAQTPTPWKIDQKQSTITFTATQNGAPISGVFTGFDGTINFDPDALALSRVDISIPLSNVEITYDMVKQQLLSGEWFDTLRYPTTRFEASRFEKGNDGFYRAFGNLTLRGVTKTVTLTFSLPEYNPTKARMEGKTALRRTEFGIGQGDWAKTNVVADTVDLTIKVYATRIEAAAP